MSTIEPLSMIYARCNKTFAKNSKQKFLNLDPDFQREYSAWDGKMKTRLIESILLGRAMNPIWVVLNDEEKCEDVLDGKHRLTTIIKFMDNEYPLSKDIDEKWSGKTFEKLTDDEQAKIHNYNININKLDSSYRKDRSKLFEMYEILNRASKPLNWFELYRPLLIPLYEILTSFVPDFIHSPVYRKDSTKRGALETELLKLLATSEENVPRSFSSLENLYKKWTEIEIGKKPEEILENIQNKKDNFSERLNRLKKYMNRFEEEGMFIDDDEKTLVYNSNEVPIKIILARCTALVKDESVFRRHSKNLACIFKEKILSLDSKELNEDLEVEGRNAQFQKALFRLVDSIINDEVKKEPRKFTQEAISKKLKEQDNKCALCKEKIKDHEKYEGDHIIPWSKGGKTVFSNLQVVHKLCHKRK